MSRSKELAPDLIPDEKVKSAYGSLVESYGEDEARVRETFAAYAEARERMNARYRKLAALEARPVLGLRRDSPRVQAPARLLGLLEPPALDERPPFAFLPPKPVVLSPEQQAKVNAAAETQRRMEERFGKESPHVASAPAGVQSIG